VRPVKPPAKNVSTLLKNLQINRRQGRLNLADVRRRRLANLEVPRRRKQAESVGKLSASKLVGVHLRTAPLALLPFMWLIFHSSIRMKRY